MPPVDNKVMALWRSQIEITTNFTVEALSPIDDQFDHSVLEVGDTVYDQMAQDAKSLEGTPPKSSLEQ
jgi:hypothetical protein